MRHPIWIAVGASLGALLLATAPAAAQERWTDPNFMASANVTVHRGSEASLFDHHLGVVTGTFGNRRPTDGADRGRRRHGHGSDGFLGGTWAWYDPDLNRSWDSDSYNDWWHDRPDRAYPRWVQHNEGCDEGRLWQGGGAWRCSW
jgi:hypothetical protein